MDTSAPTKKSIWIQLDESRTNLTAAKLLKWYCTRSHQQRTLISLRHKAFPTDWVDNRPLFSTADSTAVQPTSSIGLHDRFVRQHFQRSLIYLRYSTVWDQLNNTLPPIWTSLAVSNSNPTSTTSIVQFAIGQCFLFIETGWSRGQHVTLRLVVIRMFSWQIHR
jgi:hypothetical protein